MPIDWVSLAPYHVLYRLLGPLGWNDKPLNTEKEGKAKTNGKDLAKLFKDLRTKLGLTQ